MSSTGVPAIAVIAGSFLSGAMMNVFLLTVPAALETTTEPRQLLRHWSRIFLNGHIKGPVICLTTASLYAVAAVARFSTGDPWRVLAAAGLSTIGMVPFTLAVMQSTNSTLFWHYGEARKGNVAARRDVERLITKWNQLNAIRALFPLAGAALGTLGSLELAAV